MIRKIVKRDGGFTFFELVVVIGIISILAVILLVQLNPSEPQKRARDTQRVKDIQTLQLIIEQYLNDGNEPPPNCDVSQPGGAVCSSDMDGGDQNCVGGWLGNNDPEIDFCLYTRNLPVDPVNAADRTCVQDATLDTEDAVEVSNCDLVYYVAFDGTNYEINVRQESTENGSEVGDDGGNSNTLLEVYNSNGNIISEPDTNVTGGN